MTADVKNGPGRQYDLEFIEEADKFVVQADLFDIERTDIQVNVRPQSVEVLALKRGNLGQLSMVFERRIPLPRLIDVQASEAHHNNGVLEVVLPFVPEPSPTFTALVERAQAQAVTHVPQPDLSDLIDERYNLYDPYV